MSLAGLQTAYYDSSLEWIWLPQWREDRPGKPDDTGIHRRQTKQGASHSDSLWAGNLYAVPWARPGPSSNKGLFLSIVGPRNLYDSCPRPPGQWYSGNPLKENPFESRKQKVWPQQKSKRKKISSITTVLFYLHETSLSPSFWCFLIQAACLRESIEPVKLWINMLCDFMQVTHLTEPPLFLHLWNGHNNNT